MPNWVTNYLTINGEEAQVAQLAKQVATPYERKAYDLFEKKEVTITCDKQFSFWNIIKPTDLKAYEDGEHNPKQEGAGHWYRWNTANWGTKWDAREVEINDRQEGVISYRFDTPWGVPEQAITTLSEQYPDLEFVLEYEEETGWGGALLITNGLGVVTDEYEYRCFECESKFGTRLQAEQEFDEEGRHKCHEEFASV